MRKQRTSDYIVLGSDLRFLMNIWKGYEIHGPGKIVDALDETHALLDALDLSVSRRLASYIGLDALRDELAGTEEGAVLDEQQGKRLRDFAGQLRQTTIAEASGLFAYVTREKRLDVSRLVDAPASLMPTGVLERLSTGAQTDVSEAFKCIAYERSTAAAFHLMRAVEESLRRLFAALVDTQGPRPLLWKAMTDQLASIRSRCRCRCSRS